MRAVLDILHADGDDSSARELLDLGLAVLLPVHDERSCVRLARVVMEREGAYSCGYGGDDPAKRGGDQDGCGNWEARRTYGVDDGTDRVVVVGGEDGVLVSLARSCLLGADRKSVV